MAFHQIIHAPPTFKTLYSNFRLKVGIILACLLMPCILYAAGFEGPGAMPEVDTVAEALQAPDDAPCVLEGHLEAKVPSRKNRYIFADATGKIVVEIKKKVFGSLTVTPQHRVRLEGEVEWSSKHPNEIEVDYLTILP